MKKLFQIIGLISLTCFSFFLTDRTSTVIKNMDEIMIQIKENKENYKTDGIDAIIKDNTIISGIRGKSVNVNKSYKNMKKNGYYSDSLFIYDYKKLNVTIDNNKDKYILGGNLSKRMISLIFKVSGSDDISSILNILKNYNVKTTFFVDYIWFTNNSNLINNLIKDGHNVEPLFEDYSDYNYEWMDMILKQVNKQLIGFCYSSKENKKNLDTCSKKNNYTIRSVELSDNIPLVDLKSKMDKGNMFSFNITSKLKVELSTIIIYIRSKGYKLVNLEDNILE